jgi:hypothetical protein
MFIHGPKKISGHCEIHESSCKPYKKKDSQNNERNNNAVDTIKYKKEIMNKFINLSHTPIVPCPNHA